MLFVPFIGADLNSQQKRHLNNFGQKFFFKKNLRSIPFSTTARVWAFCPICPKSPVWEFWYSCCWHWLRCLLVTIVFVAGSNLFFASSTMIWVDYWVTVTTLSSWNFNYMILIFLTKNWVSFFLNRYPMIVFQTVNNCQFISGFFQYFLAPSTLVSMLKNYRDLFKLLLWLYLTNVCKNLKVWLGLITGNNDFSNQLGNGKI